MSGTQGGGVLSPQFLSVYPFIQDSKQRRQAEACEWACKGFQTLLSAPAAQCLMGTRTPAQKPGFGLQQGQLVSPWKVGPCSGKHIVSTQSWPGQHHHTPPFLSDSHCPACPYQPTQNTKISKGPHFRQDRLSEEMRTS